MVTELIQDFPVTAAILFLIVFVLFLYWYGTHNFAVLKTINAPGPKPLPFLGNLLEVWTSEGIHLQMLEWIRKYGKVFTVSLGRKPSIVVADPEILKQIMVKDFSNFTNRYIPASFTETFKNSVFASRDAKWKRIRSTLTPSFTAGKMKQMVSMIEKSCDTLLEKLQNVADTGQSVDMLDWFSRLTLEVILSTAFGVDTDVQVVEDNAILQHVKAIFRTPASVRLILRLPFGKRFFLFLFKLKGRKLNFLQLLAADIIKERRQYGLTGRKDLLQLMLTAHKETTADGSSKMTDDEIIAQSETFLLAGYETSSNTLGFIAYQLALHPEIQDKLRAEIKGAIEANPDAPLYDLTHGIEYLDCVINETLRMCPPAFQLNRECGQDYTVNGFHIPAGMEVIIPFYSLHWDSDAWPNPEKFDPERFRGPAKESRHPFQFLPFGAGPRNCIGMRFGLMEIKIALVKILSKYKFVRSPETQVPLVMLVGVTLCCRDGIHVRVESAE